MNRIAANASTLYSLTMDAVRVNAMGQPVGFDVPGWVAPPVPPHTPMSGRLCRLEPLALEHARPLWDAFGVDRDGRNWTYLAQEPFERYAEFEAWVAQSAASVDPQFYAALFVPSVSSVAMSSAAGIASYLRITPSAGTIEVGHIHFSPRLQHTPAATEAMYLMMRRAFELGYRRYEWKCDALNAPSRRAAQRLGFSYEGVFRQALVTRVAIATRPGTRASIASGRDCKLPSRPGCSQTTSMPTAASGRRSRH
jgi:RimJ/RimL family protein N-acetyltransferase